MPHAYWSGFLRLSLVSCPIYLSPATSERERISLHQINPKTGNRIRLQPVDAETGEELDRADLIRGYEVEKGQYIEITKEELASLKIESSRVLELARFVERESINELYLDTPYYVYPENAGRGGLSRDRGGACRERSRRHRPHRHVAARAAGGAAAFR